MPRPHAIKQNPARHHAICHPVGGQGPPSKATRPRFPTLSASKVFLSGCIGLGNTGDEAYGQLLTHWLAEIDPAIRLTVNTHDEQRTRDLFGVRPDLRSDYGGDTTQILRTHDQLHRLGVDVVLADTLDLQPSDFDIVHLFHLTRVYETHAQLRSVRAADPQVSIVLSPIYWPTGETTIRRALNRALTATHDPAAVHHRLARFTWQKAAQSTLAAYERVMTVGK